MTDKKLSDNEIIKLLEHYRSIVVIRKDDMSWSITVGDFLDLIKRYEAEFERLKTETRFYMTLPELEAREEYAKAKAIKEFAERLKDIYAVHDGLHITIDNLVKEMAGEDNA